MAKVVKVNEIYAERAKAPEALTIVHFGHKLRDTPIGSNSVPVSCSYALHYIRRVHLPHPDQDQTV